MKLCYTHYILNWLVNENQCCTWMAAFAPHLALWLAVCHLGEVLARLDWWIVARRCDAGSFLHVLHLHLLVVDPEVRRPQVLLAALPLTGTVTCSLPAQRMRNAPGEEGQEKKTLHPSSFISTKWKHCGVERAVNSPPVAVLKSDHLDHKTVWIQMKFGIMSWTASNSWRLWNKIMLTEMWRGELWNYTDIINGIIQKLSEPEHHFYLYLYFWGVFLCFKSLKMFCCFVF